ncbi:MAG: leucine-rich repeat domain-containing protein, partial [Candidatus Methanomethylophilaceae archaeon]|nr:leucine-rich repeat domain-containing protein [Candidatus Methanomethylophilaceae archaeon]
MMVATLLLLAVSIGMSAQGADASSAGMCGDDLEWELDDNGTLTIRGSGGMYSYGAVGWHGLGAGIERVVFDGPVTSIGDYAFQNCSSLESVDIPSSVTSIGKYAFRGCSSLSSVEIPEGVTSIGQYAFQGCSSLSSVDIPEGVAS